VSTRLERSATNRVIAGVCGGFAEYLAVDATFVRVLFVLAAIFSGGLFVIAYIAMVFLMPLPGRPASGFAASAGTTANEVAASLRKTADDIAHSFRDPGTSTSATGTTTTTTPAPEVVDPAVPGHESERRRIAFGYLLILVGVIFFLSNAGVFRGIQWQIVWPLVVIALGVLLLVQRVRT
jgi:phage shock protein PspC (stress-responsive transcriptional regulator)